MYVRVRMRVSVMERDLFYVLYLHTYLELEINEWAYQYGVLVISA